MEGELDVNVSIFEDREMFIEQYSDQCRQMLLIADTISKDITKRLGIKDQEMVVYIRERLRDLVEIQSERDVEAMKFIELHRFHLASSRN